MAISPPSLLLQEAEFLTFLNNQTPADQRKLISNLTTPQLKCVSEILSNFLKGNLTSDKEIIKKLKPKRDTIRTLARKKTPLCTKSAILSSRQGGGILSVILPLAASLVSSLV